MPGGQLVPGGWPGSSWTLLGPSSVVGPWTSWRTRPTGRRGGDPPLKAGLNRSRSRREKAGRVRRHQQEEGRRREAERAAVERRSLLLLPERAGVCHGGRGRLRVHRGGRGRRRLHGGGGRWPPPPPPLVFSRRVQHFGGRRNNKVNPKRMCVSN